LDLEGAAAPGDVDSGVVDGGGGGGSGGEAVGNEALLCSTDEVVQVPCVERRRSLSIAVCVGRVDVEHNVVCSTPGRSAAWSQSGLGDL